MDMTADPSLATTVLTILGAAFGVMFATLTTLLVVSIRAQHRDSLETRKENRELIEAARKETRQLVEGAVGRLSAEFEEHKRVTDKVVTSLNDARERLARIEGYLRIQAPAPTSTDPDPDPDPDAAAPDDVT